MESAGVRILPREKPLERRRAGWQKEIVRATRATSVAGSAFRTCPTDVRRPTRSLEVSFQGQAPAQRNWDKTSGKSAIDCARLTSRPHATDQALPPETIMITDAWPTSDPRSSDSATSRCCDVWASVTFHAERAHRPLRRSSSKEIDSGAARAARQWRRGSSTYGPCRTLRAARRHDEPALITTRARRESIGRMPLHSRRTTSSRRCWTTAGRANGGYFRSTTRGRRDHGLACRSCSSLLGED